MRKLVTQHLTEEDIAASVKKGKTSYELTAIDTGSDLEVNGGDSFEMVVPKLN
jgi:hypothetical protein